jgi:hypothetical protein
MIIINVYDDGAKIIASENIGNHNILIYWGYKSIKI